MGDGKEMAKISLKVIAGLLAAICLYVLSYGPVELISVKTDPPERIVKGMDLFYTPLVWLDAHSNLFHAFMNYYGDFWGVYIGHGCIPRR